MTRPREGARRAAFVAVAFASFVTPAVAAPQSLDLFPSGPLVVTQAIQSPTAPLITGRSTFVRVTVGHAGTLPPGTLVDAILRVYVGGVEQPYSPIHSDNGPIAVPAGAPDMLQEHHTLNFVFVPPHTGTVVFRAEVNPAGPNHVPEIDTANNIGGALAVFHCRRGTEVVYVPIDYRPSGGPVPNVPDPDLIAPGSGDNFLVATYPIPFFDYRRSEAPSKLWTSSLSGSGSGLNNALLVDMQMMSPQPDFVYGWVPGGLPYNGLAISIPGKVAMGNTETFRFQRTFAHEVGHLHGLVHIGGTTGQVGVDVERHLKITEQLGTIKAPSLADYMVAGLSTNQAWVGLGSYNVIFNHAAYACQQASTIGRQGPPEAERRLLVAGLLDHRSGTVRFTDSVELGRGELTAPVPLVQANLVVRAFADDREVIALPVQAASSADACPECRGAGDSDDEVTESGFVVLVPSSTSAGAPVERIEVWARGGREPLATLARSAHAPVAAFARDVVPFHGQQLVEWAAADADGDALVHYLRYSPDGERLVPLASATDATSWRVDFTELPAARSGEAYLELLTTDGLRTTVVRARPAGTMALAVGNRPWVHILSPDAGTTWLRGATVVLHGSAWDLEDRSLLGTSVEWSSDVDGVLAYGRVAQVAGLSVGTHQITMRATDSDGMVSADTHVITVVDRGLPGAPVVCQPDLGSGGPGSAKLSVCGQPLAGGNVATVRVQGAAPNAPVWLAISGASTPLDIFGGTLLTGIPDALLPIGATAPNGALALPFSPAGGTAATLYLQALVFDGAQPQGIALTNAILAQFLP